MDKEAVIHIKNGLLLGHKKEYSSNEVDEPRAHYTEWSKSEREKTNAVYKLIYVEFRKTVPMILHAGRMTQM